MEKLWIVAYPGGLLFGAEGLMNLGVLKEVMGKQLPVYCSDLSIRKIKGFSNRKLLGWSQIHLLGVYWAAVPETSEPVAYFHLDELKEMVLKDSGKSIAQIGIRRKSYRSAIAAATTYEQVFQLLRNPATYPGLESY